jgi:hypothetical protein
MKRNFQYYKKYNGISKDIFVVLKDIGISNVSLSNIRAIASRNDIKNYKHTKAQDIIIINLAKKGMLIKKRYEGGE